jgi:hypothetical protein
MDSHNLFLTPVTYRLLRLEYLVALVGAAVLLLIHFGDVRWPAFVLLFVYIDVIGYLPGHFVWRRNGGHVPRAYYVLYNTMHSLLTAGLVAGVWCLTFGPEWALLALPLHLCGDRALFGNFLKPFGFAFEPATHPAYDALRSTYDHADQDASAELRPTPVGSR